MKIEMWSDFSCPFCYIAKKRLESVLNEIPNNDIKVIYNTYQLNPNLGKIAEGNYYSLFAKSHNMTEAMARQRLGIIINAAKEAGLNYNYDILQMTNTFDAHRLAKWANTKNLEDKLTSRLMKAYFEEGFNLSDYDVLVKLAKEVGLNELEAKDILNNNKYLEDVNNQLEEAKSLGVTGVPFILINRKYAISGAQPKNVFKETILKALDEDKPFVVIGGDAPICDDGSCEI